MSRLMSRILYLKPADVLVSAEPVEIAAVVSSGVVVCFWDPLRRVGGACHYLLPTCPHRSLSSGRYGSTALPILLTRIHALGGLPAAVQARLVGGSTVHVRQTHETPIGVQNVEVALKSLRSVGIQVVEQHAGGHRSRKLTFRTDDGSLKVEQV